MRNLDKNYVNVLKSELFQRPLSFTKPLTGIVKDLKDKSRRSRTGLVRYALSFNSENVGFMRMKYLDNVSERIKLMF